MTPAEIRQPDDEPLQPNCKFQHSEEELRYVADILAALNRKPSQGFMLACDGDIQVYWSDSLIGEIVPDPYDEPNTWVYLPCAASKKGDAQ